MDSQPKDSYGYPTSIDARQPMGDAGEELVEGPDGNFDVVELEELAWRREWTQVGKKEKPSIMCKNITDLRLVEWQQKENITTWLKKPIRLRKPQITVCSAYKYSMWSVALSAFIQEDLTNEQWQAAQDITEKWNGPEGPSPKVQVQMRIISLAGWKNEEGIIHACWAKMGDPVKLVTNNEGNIWIGDLHGHNHNSTLQMVQGYLTVHYHHHMHILVAMELLNFWKEHQKSLISADDSTDMDDDNMDTGEEATNDMNIPEIISRRKSSDTRHQCKKTPMPFRFPAHVDTDDEEQHDVMSTKDERAGNEAFPVVKHPSTSRQSMIQLKGSWVTAELQDASGYMDDDKFNSIPYADVCTTQSGLSSQHDQGRKLKSAMKTHVGCKQNNMEA
ncbi:hypothetical protein EDD16DRAFT_1523581 [Pisolithus croceorrhizus]|nr:hypothetical protein EDD16DRAFT_1523581 [Pisolithus croceorrhizus]KAI6122412.1 hypothetical protein EV401DRAFT_1887222 [Pisolithus croceorrhizus]KAI6166303.1 hypothetical protein EDD17DRAFT_1505226 [Pisolithus thermaeus]